MFNSGRIRELKKRIDELERKIKKNERATKIQSTTEFCWETSFYGGLFKVPKEYNIKDVLLLLLNHLQVETVTHPAEGEKLELKVKSKDNKGK